MSGATAQADAAKSFAEQRAHALVGDAPNTARPTRRGGAPYVGYAPPATEKVLAASAAWQLACLEALSPPKSKSFKGRLKGGAAAFLAAQHQLLQRESAAAKLEESERAQKQVRLIALDCSSLDGP